MSEYTIRLSVATDFERIFAIWVENQNQAIGKQSEPNKVELLKQELWGLFSNARSVFYVAELPSKQIIGWQALLPLLSNPLLSKHTAQSNTYVDMKYFNEDIGTKLVEFAVNDAKRLGIDQIYGWVKADNVSINRIAQKFTEQKIFIPRPANNNLPDINLYIISVK